MDDPCVNGNRHRSSSSILVLIAASIAGFFFSSFIPARTASSPAASSSSLENLSHLNRAKKFTAPPPTTCEPPSSLRLRFTPNIPDCILPKHVDMTAITFRFNPPKPTANNANAVYEVSMVPMNRFRGSNAIFAKSIISNYSSSSFVFTVADLLPDMDYRISVMGKVDTYRNVIICERSISTTSSPGDNLVRNAGFEDSGDPPYLPTRFDRSESGRPRMWTPFYNGGLHLACGSEGLPRTGNCCAELGYKSEEENQSDDPNLVQKFFGVHQAIPLYQFKALRRFSVGAYFRISKGLLDNYNAKNANTNYNESSMDSLALIVSYTWDNGTVDDGIVVPILVHESSVDNWKLLCIQLVIPEERYVTYLHIYFHRHDFKAGSLFIDDVFVRPSKEKDGTCSPVYLEAPIAINTQPPILRTKDPIEETKLHLVARNRPKSHQLTLAIPMTSERVLRLEAMSRLYGGGPIVAAVLITSTKDAEYFTDIWNRKPWLHRYVDVRFYKHSETGNDGIANPIPINALRNSALSLARTEFVSMLDVDMTPATGEFSSCFGRENTYLDKILVKGAKRVLILPVFIPGSNERTARTKGELMNLIGMGKGSIYCLISQKPFKLSRWFRETIPYDVRFMAGFEPYGIARREEFPRFDERFVGYGFNKISWTLLAERKGHHLIASTNAFVTHLNHVENDWVQSIHLPKYLNTWRRYYSFVAELY